jgi:hypothetical protein
LCIKRVTFAEKDSAGASASALAAAALATATAASKKLVLPTVSEILGGKKLSPKKYLEGGLF